MAMQIDLTKTTDRLYTVIIHNPKGLITIQFWTDNENTILDIYSDGTKSQKMELKTKFVGTDYASINFEEHLENAEAELPQLPECPSDCKLSCCNQDNSEPITQLDSSYLDIEPEYDDECYDGCTWMCCDPDFS